LNIFTSKNGEEFEINTIGSQNMYMFTIEKNTWFAMKSTGSFSLIGCTVAPAFEFEDLELAPKNWKPTNFNQEL
jgi:predicted cupin superfamily sugar epimerase